MFEQTDGGYDVKSTGVNNAGAKAGAKVLRELIDKGVMPRVPITAWPRQPSTRVTRR